LVAISQPLLDSGRMGLVVLDPDHNIHACYGKLVEWLNSGLKATDVIPILVGLDDILEQIAAGNLPSFSLSRVSWHGSKGEDLVFSMEIAAANEPGFLHIVLRDETEIATLEQEVIQQRNELSLAYNDLTRAKDRAEKALREKAAFLANISHDLKTPLQVIMGNAEILKSELPKAERDKFLDDILENSDFLLTLINDLLEASAVESEQLELAEERIDIDRMLERVLTMARQLPGGQLTEFALTTDRMSPFVKGDPTRFQRLLLNIVSNAVKFTSDHGHVTIRVLRTDDGDMTLEISDDGCGIEPDMIDRVFEPFTRSGVAEGSGLGLHIAKGLANLHDAELSLKSEPGFGTTATLHLPKSRLVEH